MKPKTQWFTNAYNWGMRAASERTSEKRLSCFHFRPVPLSWFRNRSFFSPPRQCNWRTRMRGKKVERRMKDGGGGVEKVQEEEEKYFPIWHKYRKVFIIRVICGNFFPFSLSCFPFVDNHIHFWSHVIRRIILLKSKTSRYFSFKSFFYPTQNSIFLIKCTATLKCLCFASLFKRCRKKLKQFSELQSSFSVCFFNL